MKDPPISLSFPATGLDVRAAMRTIVRHLRKRGIDRDTLATTEIAVTEALNNIVEHGYADTGAKEIFVRLWVDASHLRIELTDSGVPFFDGVVPSPAAHDLGGPVGDLPEGGFGWRMIRRLASSIRYEHRGGKNHLNLFIERPDATPSGRQGHKRSG
jgi:serine/threonine-protein kinase RsbW